MIIVGAGLAGLIAGHVFPAASIIERDPKPEDGAHKALLRFRTDAVGLLTGIPFRRVTVHKGIWYRGAFVQPTIELANWYSHKVTGQYLDRSIWDLAPVDRFIAPEDFYERMVRTCGRRIKWEHDIQYDYADEPRQSIECETIVSTIPLHVAANLWLPRPESPIEFNYAPISVRRWRLPNTNVHQTIYFPDESTNTYRASITGSLLIVESMAEEDSMGLGEVLGAFGITAPAVDPLGAVRQSYGKIAPIEERLRRQMIYRLTSEAGVYSAGRFGVWKNLLLDDVLADLLKIRTMIEGADAYEHRLKADL